MKIITELAEEVVKRLQGTCLSDVEQTLEDIYEEDPTQLGNYDFNNMPKEFYAYIDNCIFLCAVCGWWCEAGDYAEEDVLEKLGEDACSDHTIDEV